MTTRTQLTRQTQQAESVCTVSFFQIVSFNTAPIGGTYGPSKGFGDVMGLESQKSLYFWGADGGKKLQTESPIAHDLRGHKVCMFLLYFSLVENGQRWEISNFNWSWLAKRSGLWNKSLNKSCFVVAIFINLCETMLTTLTCMNSDVAQVAFHISIQYVQHLWLANNTWKGFRLQSNHPLNIGNMSEPTKRVFPDFKVRTGYRAFASNFHILRQGLRLKLRLAKVMNLLLPRFPANMSWTFKNRKIAIGSTSKKWISSFVLLQ